MEIFTDDLIRKIISEVIIGVIKKMKKNKNVRFVILVLVVTLLGVMLAGCQTQSSEQSDEKVLTVGYDRDAELLDTIKTAWYSDALIYIHDRLVTRDYDFSYKPGLAKNWETSDDGLVWTFNLRDDVKFHDGTDFTSKDVKWTLDTILDPETGSPYIIYLG